MKEYLMGKVTKKKVGNFRQTTNIFSIDEGKFNTESNISSVGLTYDF